MYVLRIPSGRMEKDLSRGHGVFNFFDFAEWHYRSRIYGRLSTHERSRVIPVSMCPDVLALRSRHDYDNNVHKTTIYSEMFVITIQINCTIS